MQALEFDPLSPFLRAHLGWTYLLARKFDNAIPELLATFKLDANFVIAHWALGRAYAAQGHFDRAIAAYEKLLDAPPFGRGLLRTLHHGTFRIPLCSSFRSRTGRKTVSQRSASLPPPNLGPLQNGTPTFLGNTRSLRKPGWRYIRDSTPPPSCRLLGA